MLKRAVITGLGALTPIGNDVESFWRNACAGQSGAGPISYFDTTTFRTKIACELKNYDATDYFDRREARKIDPFCQFALIVADEALAKSGLLESDVDRNRVGVVWSTGVGGLQTLEEELFGFATGDGRPLFSPFFVTKMIADISSGQISIRHDLRGLNFNTVSACSSSTNALIDAFNYVRLGKADAVLAGGSEAAVTASCIGGFSSMKALSRRNDDPARASRPFDVHRDGFVLGEGAGALVVEEYEHARRRGAHIYAEIVGGGLSADAYHVAATHPEGAGAQRAIRDALNEAGLQPADVDYINAHATSTSLGDLSELKALELLFADDLANVAISATKSMTGHLLGAAGAVEAILTVLALEHNCVPPTINTEETDPDVDSRFQFVLGSAKARELNVAMSNTFGFGGHNAIAVFKKNPLD